VSGGVSRPIGAEVGRVPAALAAIALGGSLLVGCGEKEENLDAGTTTAASSAAEIAGDWTGQLSQKDLPPFQVAVRIEASGKGQVAYTGINCGGTWTQTTVSVGSTGATFSFEETIDQGADGTCKGSGLVVLTHRANDSLSYRFMGGGIISRGVLQRTDAAGLRPVFERAGLPPPA
jgi:hypothetical protein